jgi:hypothetical protein
VTVSRRETLRKCKRSRSSRRFPLALRLLRKMGSARFHRAVLGIPAEHIRKTIPVALRQPFTSDDFRQDAEKSTLEACAPLLFREFRACFNP